MTASIALVTCAQLAGGEDTQVLGPALSALERELIEPSLLFQYDQDAAARFASAVSRRL